MALSPKQARFVSEYLIDLNGKQACIRAGYSENGATVQAVRLLANATVAAAVAEGKSRQLASADLSAARVLEELRRCAFIDARSFWDDDGELKPLKDLTPEQGSALAGFEVIVKNAKAGDGQQDTVHKIKLWDKPRNLEMLAKHFGLLVDKLEVSGVQDVVDVLRSRHQRHSREK